MRKTFLMSVFAAGNMAWATEVPKLGMPYRTAEWNNDVPGFVKGKIYLSGGIGGLNLNYRIANAMKSSIAPNWKSVEIERRNTWFGKAEYALTPHVGLGVGFSYSGLNINVKMDSVTSMNIPIDGTLKYRTWSALARVNYHIIQENNFDLYIGTGLGFRANNFSVTDNDPIYDRWNFPIDLGIITRKIPHTLSVPTFGADFTVGMRYHILPPIAVYAEFGVAKSFAQGGITIRI